MAQVVLALIVVAAAVFYILVKAPQTDAQTPASAAPAVAAAPVPRLHRWLPPRPLPRLRWHQPARRPHQNPQRLPYLRPQAAWPREHRYP